MWRSMLLATSWWALWPAVICCSGCGSGSLTPVSGTIRLDGALLSSGSVTFYPDEAKGNKSQDIPVGEITDGKYELYTNGRRGAPRGAYRVVVVAFAAPPQKKGGTAESPKSLVAPKFGDWRTTPLVAEVTADATRDAYHFTISK